MCADLGWNDLGHFNGGLTRTASIDALISQGVLLERFHTFKVCAPSRASTMSGRYQFNVGFYEMPKDDANQCLSNTTLLPELLRAMGYSTHALGSASLREAFAPPCRV
jgi:arylsulfatase B